MLVSKWMTIGKLYIEKLKLILFISYRYRPDQSASPGPYNVQYTSAFTPPSPYRNPGQSAPPPQVLLFSACLTPLTDF